MEATQGSTIRLGGAGGSPARNRQGTGNVQVRLSMKQLISHGWMPRCEVKLVRVDATIESSVSVPIPRRLREGRHRNPGETQADAANQSRRGCSNPQGVQEGSKRLQCPQCSRRFSTKLNLTLHQKMSHRNERSQSTTGNHGQRPCSQVGSSTTNQRSGSGASVGKRDPVRFRCPACTKSYAHNRNLTIHQKIHQNPDAFKCNHCSLTFGSSVGLLQHRNTYTGRFRCKVCHRNCQSKFFLDIHQRKHTGEKPFSCGTCNKRFASKFELGLHQRGYHDRELRYSCQNCDLKFIWYKSMQRHAKTCGKRQKTSKFKKTVN